jgi:hypothetical protein
MAISIAAPYNETQYDDKEHKDSIMMLNMQHLAKMTLSIMALRIAAPYNETQYDYDSITMLSIRHSSKMTLSIRFC